MSLYKETLMKHFRNPEHKIENSDFNSTIDGVNPSCGDNLTLFIELDNKQIKDISYTGNGCAISMASSDIMCSVLKGAEDPKKIAEDFLNMISGAEIDFTGELAELDVFKEMQNFPARRSCATLPWNTILKVL